MANEVHDDDDECIHILGMPKAQCTICNGYERGVRLGLPGFEAYTPARRAGRGPAKEPPAAVG